MPDCHSHPVLTEPHRRSSYFAPGAHLDHTTGRRPIEPQRPQLAADRAVGFVLSRGVPPRLRENISK